MAQDRYGAPLDDMTPREVEVPRTAAGEVRDGIRRGAFPVADLVEQASVRRSSVRHDDQEAP
jgi:hypothetical protein